MKRTKTLYRTLAIATAACLLCFSIVQAKKPPNTGGGGGGGTGVSYTIYALDDMGGDVTGVIPRDINSAGQVVGQVDDPDGGILAVYWSTNTANGTSQLQFLEDGAVATSINTHGAIVGSQAEADGNWVGRYWVDETDNAPLRLPPLPADESSGASGINQDGVIVGRSNKPGLQRPVVWRIVDGNVEGPFKLPNLRDIDPTADGSARAINDNAQGLATVVGNFFNVSPNVAVRWTIGFDTNGQLEAAGEVLASGAGASGINNNDVVCGHIQGGTPSSQAVVWLPAEQILHRLKDAFTNSAIQINANGLIVGSAWIKNGAGREDGFRAVMWSSATAEMLRLDKFLSKRSSLVFLSDAMAVNDSDVIVGRARIGAFLALPK